MIRKKLLRELKKSLKPQVIGQKEQERNTYARQDETIEPTYEDGVIRVLESDWEKIKDLLPEGAKHHLVESTNHHLILFTAEAYAEIDFMMYEMNFCEQEMHYEDLVNALGYYTQEDKIKILDMCELQTSVITEIDGQIIKCEVGEGEEEGMSVADLTSALSGLSGLAIAYGKFKEQSRRKQNYGSGWRYGESQNQKATTTTKTSTKKPVGSTSTKSGGSTKPKPIQNPVSKSSGQKTLMDFGERDDSSAVYTDEELDRIYSEKYIMDKPPMMGDRFDFMAQEGFAGRGYNWRTTSTATASSAPIVAKYHPIYGIKGKKLQVDRYVDLTPLIEVDEAEVKEAESKMECPPATQDVALNTKNRNETIKQFGYGPLNVDAPGDFWEKIAKQWNTTVESAKKSKCGNCVAFDESPRMKDCMPGETSDGEGTLGYCWMHHFKCHSARTCDTWAKGGPITTNKVSEGWSERAFAKSEKKEAETFESQFRKLGSGRHALDFSFDEMNVSWDEIKEVIEEYTNEWDASGLGFGDVDVIVVDRNEENLKDLYRDLESQFSGYIAWEAETFEASEGGFKLNVATTPVDEAYAYAKGEFEKRGKRMEDYIPHFYESYESLQESCKTAIDVPRIEMPVIGPRTIESISKVPYGGSIGCEQTLC